MRRALAVMLAGLALAACDESPGGGADPAKGANAERYARDRQQCQAQADQQMRTRQRVDDSRRATFDDNQDRFGRSALPDTMANYGETRSSDRIVERCLQARGWAQDQKSWWQKITG
jgi:hypothetical protein